MNNFAADPHWRWWIVWYFYLGGISAGAYFISSLMDLIGGANDRSLARVGYLLAAPLVGVCGILLILDLDQPTRFWHMLFDAETLLPHLKYWSPMSIGAWALLLFSIVSTISFLGAAWDVGVLKLRPCSVPSRLHGTWLGRTFDFVGAIAGFFIASYTGALLSATNQPIWSDSKWIAALFLVSSAATGIAAVQVASRLTGMGDSASHEKLSRLDTGVLALELILIAMFVSSLPVPWPDLLGQWPIVLLLTGALGVGVLIPLVMRGWSRAPESRPAILIPLLVLAGGFMLRYAVLMAAPAFMAVRAR